MGVLLEFEEVIFAKKLPIPSDLVLGCFVVPIRKENGYLGGRATRKADQALPMFLEQFLIDPRTVMETLEMGARYQLEQIPVSGVVLGNQHQVIGGTFVGGAVAATSVSDVKFTTDDRFDAGVLALGVEIDHAVEGTVVRDAHGIHAQFSSAAHQIGDTADAVEHTVFGMRVQMGKHDDVA